MERHIALPGRVVLSGALMVSSFLAMGTGTGCRSTPSEVPPHKPFMTDGRKAPPINFSGDGANLSDGLPQVNTGQPNAFGTPNPGASERYGAPTSNTFGPPGTSALGTLPGGDATKPGLGGFQSPGAVPGRMVPPTQVPTQSPFGNP